MNIQFRSLNSEAQQLIAKEMNVKGSSCIANFFTQEQLSSLQQYVGIDADKHNGQYFAHHGGTEIESSLIGVLGAAPEFRELLASIYQTGTGKAAYSDEILKVLRCVQGNSGRRESNCFHYDASLVTVLLPIVIPQNGTDRGDLIIFPNLRRVRSNVLFNVFEKALLQNALSRKLITTAIRHHLLKPERLQLVPGNLYLFWGYRTLHANEPCDPASRRATAILHYGDPHAGSFATRMILKLNQRRARRATALGTQPTA
ncbi:hypothetical protein CH92_13475 [Stutzerimonas stutzeri]|uniref:Uncharacterized protein n=2 Tax=Stutzerimonas stutzeri TaxID=316 RepID=W8R8X6_STUST|nr:hypothetical protein CH92_13475 [Stutzerimonas stutzeri]